MRCTITTSLVSRSLCAVGWVFMLLPVAAGRAATGPTRLGARIVATTPSILVIVRINDETSQWS